MQTEFVSKLLAGTAPFAIVMGVLDWRPLIVWSLIIVAIIALTTLNYVTKHTATWSQASVFVLLGLLCVVSTFVAGPFVMVPTLIATFVAALQAHPSRRMRRIVVVGGCALLVGLGGAEWAGVLPTAYSFVDGTMVIHPLALALPEVPMRVLLVMSSLGSTLAVALFLSTLRDTLAAAQERVSLLGWHLRQMVPESTPQETSPPSSR